MLGICLMRIQQQHPETMGVKPAHFIGCPKPSGRALNQLLYLVLPVTIALWMKEQKGATVAILAG
jgi:hypothetical protein